MRCVRVLLYLLEHRRKSPVLHGRYYTRVIGLSVGPADEAIAIFRRGCNLILLAAVDC
ncbi:MAG: hypothetical protein IJS05_08895 [Paludibacteraceae bacterium]|nr:hypothetical protein [Paludibacteraceae bacterium]